MHLHNLNDIQVWVLVEEATYFCVFFIIRGKLYWTKIVCLHEQTHNQNADFSMLLT